MTSVQRIRLIFILVLATLLRQPVLVGIEHATYWFDEKFMLENAADAALSGKVAPPRHVYYPALAHYPHALGFVAVDAVNRWLAGHGGEPLFDLRGSFGHQIYVGRRVQGLIGILTVLLTFAAGRRLWSVEAGLGAALLLALSPAHIANSMEIKPHAPLTLAVVLALLAAIRVRDRPQWPPVLVAGFAIGTAVACNYNSVTAAIPLVVALLLARLGVVATALRLGVAAMVSLATFVLWNPFFAVAPRWYIDTLRRFARAYHGKELAHGLPPLSLAHTVADQVGARYLGWLAAMLLCLALAVMAIEIARRRHGGPEARQRAGSHLLALAFPIAHVLFTMKMTLLYLPQHYAPIIPFLALCAGYGLAFLLAWRRSLPPLPRHALGAALVPALVLLLPLGAWRLYRESGIDSTRERVFAEVRRGLPERGSVLSLGVETPPADLKVLPLDRATRAPVELIDSTTWMVAPRAALARALLRGNSAGLAPESLLALWLHPRLMPIENWRREPWAVVGEEMELFRVSPSELIAIETRELPFAAFRLDGSGAFDLELLWLKGSGAVATAALPLRGAPGELIEIEVVAGADDSGLVAGGELLLGLSMGTEPSERVVRVERNALQRYRSWLLPAEVRGPLRLRYAGGEGGRVYLTRIQVVRLTAASNLRPATLGRRSQDLAAILQAGL